MIYFLFVTYRIMLQQNIPYILFILKDLLQLYSSKIYAENKWNKVWNGLFIKKEDEGYESVKSTRESKAELLSHVENSV